MMRALIATAVLLMVTGCVGGDEAADTTSADTTTESTDNEASDGDGAEPEDTDGAEEPEAYDETIRVPLAELPDRLADTIAGQGGDPDANQCVIDRVLAAYDDGELAPGDLDAYVRLGALTETMEAFLQQLQNSGVCAPR